MNKWETVRINGDFLQWKEVCSGVPQVPVLGSVLFNLLINELDLGVDSVVATIGKVIENKLANIIIRKWKCKKLWYGHIWINFPVLVSVAQKVHFRTGKGMNEGD